MLSIKQIDTVVAILKGKISYLSPGFRAQEPDERAATEELEAIITELEKLRQAGITIEDSIQFEHRCNEAAKMFTTGRISAIKHVRSYQEQPWHIQEVKNLLVHMVAGKTYSEARKLIGK